MSAPSTDGTPLGGDCDAVALVTCAALPGGDEDAEVLLHALARRSLRARWVAWNAPDVEWARFALVVIRSAWDYTADRQAFLSWAATIDRLHNPVPVLAWNSDKIYLRELAAAAIAVVATNWIAPNVAFVAPSIEFVLKPTIGAGSKGAGRFDPRDASELDAARAHAGALHEAGRTVMVQPYLREIDDTGEAALMYVDGQFSHAITKRAMLAPATVNPLEVGYSRSLFVPERISARIASAAELAVGERVIAYVRDRFGEPLYARVDLLPTPEGPVVIELELTEPSLFLGHGAGSADRFAAAIAGRLGQ